MNQPPKLWIVAERPVRLPSFCRKCRAVFEKLMGDVSPEFEIGDFAWPPLAYQSTRTIDPGPRSFGDGLKAALDLRTTSAHRN